ncbi:MAG: hypothetical protein H6704_22050 [Myxococcales bacterium]|nr:hypothetical protein [Myxococcales bacterium]
MRVIPAALLLLCAGCATSHLEVAKRRHADGLAALAQGRPAVGRAALLDADAEARRSVAADEEGGGSPQAWLIAASARLSLGDRAAADEALAKVRAAGQPLAAAWARRVVWASHCRWAEQRGWHHFAALCHDGLLADAQGDDAAPAVRAFAAVGLANAHAQRKPGYADLVASFDGPLVTRLLAVARAHPLEADLVAVLARRLAFGCADADFVARIEGWRAFQVDLLEAAVALDGFSSEDRRRSAKKDLERARAGRLCARQAPP